MQITLEGCYNVSSEIINKVTVIFVEEAKKEVKGYQLTSDLKLKNIYIDCGAIFYKMEGVDSFSYNLDGLQIVISKEFIESDLEFFMPIY